MFQFMFAVVASATLLLTFSTPSALAQETSPAAKTSASLLTEFISKQGKAVEAEAILALLRKRAAGLASAPVPDEHVLRRSAVELALAGYTAEKIERLQARGVDVAKLALKVPNTLTLAEKVALSQLAVIAQVVGVDSAASLGDGFLSSVTMRVQEVMAGEALGEIVVRLRSGVNPETGRRIRVSHELVPEVGQRHLLFLSQPMYRFIATYAEDLYGYPPPGRAAGDQARLEGYVPIYRSLPLETLSKEELARIREMSRLLAR